MPKHKKVSQSVDKNLTVSNGLFGEHNIPSLSFYFHMQWQNLFQLNILMRDEDQNNHMINFAIGSTFKYQTFLWGKDQGITFVSRYIRNLKKPYKEALKALWRTRT